MSDDSGRPTGNEIEPEDRDGAGELVRRLVDTDDTDESRGRLLGRLAARLARSARTAGARSVAGGRWLTDTFAEDIAPRVPIRDAATLRAHHNGAEGEDLAEALTRTAALGTTAVGAVGGAATAATPVAPPLLLTAPALITAETVTVAAIEVKLIAELHEAYGQPASGGHLRRTSSYLASWAHRRGIDPLSVESVEVVLGAAARMALRNRLARLMGRHLTTLGPYLTGAVAGGSLNRAGTLALASAVRADLRVHASRAVDAAPPPSLEA